MMTSQPTPDSDHQAPQSEVNSTDSGPAPGTPEVDPSAETSPDVVSELLRLGRLIQKNKPADA